MNQPVEASGGSLSPGIISEYTGENDRDQLRQLYGQYITELQSIEPSYPGSKDSDTEYWWESREDLTLLYLVMAGRPTGFVIIVSGRWVDSDVDCEICEMYIEKPFRSLSSLRSLMGAAMKHLSGRAGFQVLVKNTRVRQVFQDILSRNLIPYTYHHALEDGLQYARYRFMGPDRF